MNLNNDEIILALPLCFPFFICSQGNYCFVKLLFQSVCVYVLWYQMYFLPWVLVKRIHETLICSRRERRFNSVGHPSLPLSRLMTLGNCVCQCVCSVEPHQHTLLLLLLLDDASLIFHSSSEKLWLFTLSPPLLIIRALTFLVFIASHIPSFAPQTCLSSTRGPRLQFCPYHVTKFLGSADLSLCTARSEAFPQLQIIVSFPIFGPSLLCAEL